MRYSHARCSLETAYNRAIFLLVEPGKAFLQDDRQFPFIAGDSSQVLVASC